MQINNSNVDKKQRKIPFAINISSKSEAGRKIIVHQTVDYGLGHFPVVCMLFVSTESSLQSDASLSRPCPPGGGADLQLN